MQVKVSALIELMCNNRAYTTYCSKPWCASKEHQRSSMFTTERSVWQPHLASDWLSLKELCKCSKHWEVCPSQPHGKQEQSCLSVVPFANKKLNKKYARHVMYLSESGPFLAMMRRSFENPPTGILSLPVVNISSCFFCSREKLWTTSQNHLQQHHVYSIQ